MSGIIREEDSPASPPPEDRGPAAIVEISSDSAPEVRAEEKKI